MLASTPWKKKELVLLVELYESYWQLKTHTTPTHIKHKYDSEHVGN